MKTDNLIRMESFDELLHALKFTHTMSIAQICNFLKVKRAWVSEYITSNVPHIMVQGAGSRTNWRAVANLALQRSDTELIWFNPAEVFAFLEKNVSSFSRQTVEICPFLFMSADSLAGLYSEFEKLYEPIANLLATKQYSQVASRKIEKDLPLSRYLPDEIARLGSECVGVTYRSKVRHIEIAQPKEVFRQYKLVAIRALIGYAGIDEVIRRELFKTGHSRLELNIKGRSDKTSKLVFYVDYQNYIDAEVLSHKKSDLSEGKYLSEFKNFISKFTWTVPYETFEKGYRDKVDRLIKH